MGFVRDAATTLLSMAFLAIASLSASAQAPVHKLKVIASFSIIADLASNVGGDRIDLVTLVGADGDAHVYSPSPADGRRLAEAKVVLVNGLKFEGWMSRLAQSSGTKATIVEAARGIKAIEEAESDARHDGHSHGGVDPHAWQDVAIAKAYVANILAALVAADPAGRPTYEANAASYTVQLDALEGEVKAAIARVPADRRRIITSHDAFAYFERAYGLDFVAPQGISTDSEASARDVARIIQQIRRERIPAVFIENISDPRLIERIAKETGAKIGERVYSDALSAPDGPAGTYIAMIRHNIRAFSTALTN
jgi:zinc/manganese transport system substrate-binding protein